MLCDEQVELVCWLHAIVPELTNLDQAPHKVLKTHVCLVPIDGAKDQIHPLLHLSGGWLPLSLTISVLICKLGVQFIVHDIGIL